MPEINIIFDHLGLGITQIKINNDELDDECAEGGSS